jgi:hypothetical protein
LHIEAFTLYINLVTSLTAHGFHKLFSYRLDGMHFKLESMLETILIRTGPDREPVELSVHGLIGSNTVQIYSFRSKLWVILAFLGA